MLERRLDSSLLGNRAFGSQLSQKTSNDEVVRLLGLLHQSRLYCEQGLPLYTTDSSGRITKNQVFVKIYRDCTDFILKYIGDEKDEERLCSDDYEPSVLVSQSANLLIAKPKILTLFISSRKKCGHSEIDNRTLYACIPLGMDNGKIGLTNRDEDKNRER